MFHSSQLKPAVGSPPLPEPPQIDSELEQEFEVEAILDKRTTRNRVLYHVCWKGYDAFKDSWELAQNLANSQENIKEYEEKYGR